METPGNINGKRVTDSICEVMGHDDDTNDITGHDDDTNGNADLRSKRPKYLKFTMEQLTQLIVACSPTQNTNTPMPIYVANAKYEAISCKAIKPTYNGTEDDLMPFLLHLDIWCQDESWAPATYITLDSKKYDLTIDLAHIPEEMFTAIASKRWTLDTADVDKHIMGTQLYHSWLLAKYLLEFISSELSLIIINRVPTTCCNDGILWVLTSNIYCNNIAFVKTTQEKIVLATVVQCGQDIEKYLMTVKNNLHMITMSSSSNDTMASSHTSYDN